MSDILKGDWDVAENTNVELVGTNDLIHQVTEKVVQDERIKGDSVTITSITTDNENNQIVAFSDGNTMAVPPGKDGDMIVENQGINYKVSLEIYDGKPRLKTEEV